MIGRPKLQINLLAEWYNLFPSSIFRFQNHLLNSVERSRWCHCWRMLGDLYRLDDIEERECGISLQY